MTLRDAALAAAFFTALASAAPAQATYITNGGFETGTFSGWTQSGDTGSTSVQMTFFTAPTQGAFQALFGPVFGLGYISQSFAATPGAPLVLTYDLFLDGAPNQFVVTFNGTIVAGGSNLAGFGYTPFSFAVTGDPSGTNTLSLGFLNIPSFFQLDNVAVTDAARVPAPAALALFGLALAGLAAARRR